MKKHRPPRAIPESSYAPPFVNCSRAVEIRPLAGENEALAAERLVACVIDESPFYSALAKSSEKQKYTTANLQKLAAADPFSVLLAVDGERPVGFCISIVEDTLLWVSWGGVLPEYRRLELSKRFHDLVVQTARSRGAHKIWCDCRTENAPSMALLGALGFSKIAVVKNHWYGHDYFLWEKEVPGSDTSPAPFI